MTSVILPSSTPRIVYPDSDGLPIAENTLQYLCIVHPDDQPFRTFIEVSKAEEQAKQRAELERQRAELALRDLEQLRQQLRSLGQNPSA